MGQYSWETCHVSSQVLHMVVNCGCAFPSRWIAAATRIIDDFNTAAWLNNWSFVPGEEFPGAKGVLIAGQGFQGGGAILRFDFACVEVIGACDPRYVAASREFNTPVPGEVLSLWVRCDACEALFRITDATGQRLTYGPVALASSTSQVELAGFWICQGRVFRVVRGRQRHPFVRPGRPSLRPNLPSGRLPRAAAVKDGRLATAAAARERP